MQRDDQPAADKPPIATGVIGFGLAGRYLHAPVIAAVPRLALAAFATSQRDAVTSAFPTARCMAPAEMIADASIDLVVIATPNNSHAPLAHAALAAGKHVVIDKPFAVDPEEAEGLIAAARSANRVLSVYHNRRWDSDFLTVQRVLREGALGDVQLAELKWDRFRPIPRAVWSEEAGPGTGVLAGLGPHLVDQTLLMFGLPDAVSADIQTQRERAQTDDYFEITLFYDTRRIVLSASNLVAVPRPRFALHGTRGSLIKHGIDTQEDMLRAGGSPTDAGYGDEPPGLGMMTIGDAPAVAVPAERGDWRRFYEGIADAIRDGAPPPVSPEDALTGLRIMEAARESARTGQVVSLEHLRG